MDARALDGVVVLELGHVYQGPYCGLLLAQMGAQVIKVEPPEGDSVRRRRAVGDSYPFLMLNAGKLGVRLDLRVERGRDILLRLVEGADVVVENYRRGVLDRLGLGYGALCAVNPRIILASGRGFTAGGLQDDVAAMDVTVQATTGVIASTGFPEQAPVKAGIAAADFLGGTHLAAGVLAALFQRERTGTGQWVQVAMQDALLPSLASNLGGLLESGGSLPERTGNRHGGLSICPYNVYACADGWVAICCTADRHWLALCRVIGREDLAADPALARNQGRVQRMGEVDDAIEAWTSRRPRRDCAGPMQRAGVPAAPVLGLGEVLDDPQVQASGMLPEVHHPDRGRVRVFASPVQLSASRRVRPTPSPRLGQHTREVLARRLALTDAELDELSASGVV